MFSWKRIRIMRVQCCASDPVLLDGPQKRFLLNETCPRRVQQKGGVRKRAKFGFSDQAFRRLCKGQGQYQEVKSGKELRNLIRQINSIGKGATGVAGIGNSIDIARRTDRMAREHMN